MSCDKESEFMKLLKGMGSDDIRRFLELASRKEKAPQSEASPDFNEAAAR